jgi:hypothetical protein
LKGRLRFLSEDHVTLDGLLSYLMPDHQHREADLRE